MENIKLMITDITVFDLFPDEGLIEGRVNLEGEKFYAVYNPDEESLTLYEDSLVNGDGEISDRNINKDIERLIIEELKWRRGETK